MIRKASEEVTLQLNRRASVDQSHGRAQQVQRTEKSTCKGPGAGLDLVFKKAGRTRA